MYALGGKKSFFLIIAIKTDDDVKKGSKKMCMLRHRRLQKEFQRPHFKGTIHEEDEDDCFSELNKELSVLQNQDPFLMENGQCMKFNDITGRFYHYITGSDKSFPSACVIRPDGHGAAIFCESQSCNDSNSLEIFLQKITKRYNFI
jgi:hypothetical protein